MPTWLFVLLSVSYLALWLGFAATFLMVAAVARGLAELRRQFGASAEAAARVALPEPEDDGPLVGSSLPDLTLVPVNGHAPVRLADGRGVSGTVLLFNSPMCQSCQRLVAPFNEAVAKRPELRFVVIMHADDQACAAFLSLFPVDAPVICDERTLTMSFGVHRSPFVLVYGSTGALTRKGVAKPELELISNPHAELDSRVAELIR